MNSYEGFNAIGLYFKVIGKDLYLVKYNRDTGKYVGNAYKITSIIPKTYNYPNKPTFKEFLASNYYAP